MKTRIKKRQRGARSTRCASCARRRGSTPASQQAPPSSAKSYEGKVASLEEA